MSIRHPYNKRDRIKIRNRKLKHLYHMHDNGRKYHSTGVFYDEGKGRLVRFYRTKRWGYPKTCSSKRIRKLPIYDEDAMLPQHGDYQKYFDLYWEYD